MTDTQTESGSGKPNGADGLPKSAPIVRRQFSNDFKRKVIARVRGGEQAVKVGAALGILPTVIRRWVKEGMPKPDKKVKGLPTGVSVYAGGRKFYSEEFMRAAVRRLQKGETARSIADDLHIHNSMIYNWLNKFAGNPRKRPNTKTVKGELKEAADGAPSFGGGTTLPVPVKDAISFLKHAKTSMNAALAAGEIKDFDEAHDLARMALRELLKLQ